MRLQRRPPLVLKVHRIPIWYAFADLVYQVAGIFHPYSKLRLLWERCGRRMKELKTETFREYFECLTVKPNRQAELLALLNEITIGETCFFRNQAQLDAVRDGNPENH